MSAIHSTTLTGAKFKIVNVSRFNYISAMLTLYCISDNLFHYSNPAKITNMLNLMRQSTWYLQRANLLFIFLTPYAFLHKVIFKRFSKNSSAICQKNLRKKSLTYRMFIEYSKTYRKFVDWFTSNGTVNSHLILPDPFLFLYNLHQY